MKFVVIAVLMCAQMSCTTLANRRDLYSPQPGPDARPVTITRTRTITTEVQAPEEAPLPPSAR